LGLRTFESSIRPKVQEAGGATPFRISLRAMTDDREYYKVQVTPTQSFEIDVRYQELKPVGSGAYGLVCSATDTKTGDKVAIKKVRDVFVDLVDAKRILREVKLLRHFGKHKNLVTIQDIMTAPPNTTDFEDLYIVTQLYDCDLHRIVSSSQPLTEQHYQYFMHQMLCGLKYIHSAKVLHRDLKPSNLLVNANCDLAICDFGLARGEPGPGVSMTEYVVTRWYRAPELLCDNHKYSAAVDVWSAGLIFAEILQRKPVLCGKDYIHQLRLIVKLLGKPDPEDLEFIEHQGAKTIINQMNFSGKDLGEIFGDATQDKNAVDLLRRMLQFNPQKRITVDEALEHPYVAELHAEASANEVDCHSAFDATFEAGYTDEMPKPLLQKHMWGMMIALLQEQRAQGAGSAKNGGASKHGAAGGRTAGAKNGDGGRSHQAQRADQKLWTEEERIADAVLQALGPSPRHEAWFRPPHVVRFYKSKKKDNRYKVLIKAQSFASEIQTAADMATTPSHEMEIFGVVEVDGTSVDVKLAREPTAEESKQIKEGGKMPQEGGCVVS
jgi:mitogen-activated protein kinase 1/3